MSHTKIIIKNNVRIYASDYTEVAAEAIKRHETLPLASLALSTAVAVFGPLGIMKKEGKVTSLFKFNGPLKNLLVESKFNGDIRALVGNPRVNTDYDNKDVNEIPIRVGIGETGLLRIVHQYKNETFGGEVKLAGGDITTDLAYYFDQSEQTQSAVISDVRMSDKNTLNRAFSVIFQLLPTHTEEDIQWIENFIKENKLSENSLDEYVKKINGMELETKETRWQCTCSREQMQGIVNLMSKEEKQDLIEKYGMIEITCNFCNKKYQFTEI